MANEFYISAGLIPDDSGDSMAANTFYVSAGLVPDDVAAGGGGDFIAAWAMNRQITIGLGVI